MRAGDDAGEVVGGGRRAAPRRSAFLLVSLASCLVSQTGCRGFGKPDTKYDLLTAELRTRERELLEARAELGQMRLLSDTYGRQPGGPGCVPGQPAAFHPAGSAPATGVRGIALANGTGGIDDDQMPGDEALQIVMVPRDDDGSPVKAVGTLRVSAYDITPEGLKCSIGRWEVPPDQLRKAWKAGLFSTGYFVPLQWDQLPAGGKVRIVAHLTTVEGREFEADKDVTVRAMPGAGQPGPAATVPTGSEPRIPPPEVPELPPPAGLKANPTSRSPLGAEELPPPAATLGAVKAIP